MQNTPEHFNEEQKEQYNKAWMDMLRVLVNAVKLMLFLVISVLVYLPFQKDIQNYFDAPQTPIIAKYDTGSETEEVDLVKDGIHVQTGLVVAPGFDLVKANCTVCHSAKLVTQNRASRAGWDQMITWMQASQGLWDLGANKTPILDYLATHYSPVKKGRRENLKINEIEWYILNLENTGE